MRLLTLRNTFFLLIASSFLLLLASLFKCVNYPQYSPQPKPPTALKWDYPFEDESNSNAVHHKEKIGSNLESKNSFQVTTPSENSDSHRPSSNKEIEFDNIVCDINGGKEIVGCKREGNEVYVPFFSFLSKYFEITGRLSEDEEKDFPKFLWLHQSNVKIFRPKLPYNSKGSFAFFDNYNVEVRDRVKCVSGSQGVPVSTQWDTKGYYYPIQIAQYGLSHYSKYVQEGAQKRIPLQPTIKIPPNSEDHLPSQFAHSPIFKVPPQQKIQIDLSGIPKTSRLLTLRWFMRASAMEDSEESLNITITAQVKYEGVLYSLYYTSQDFLIQWRIGEKDEDGKETKAGSVWHGLGGKSGSGEWQEVIRDLGIDLQKGVSLSSNTPRGNKRKGSKGSAPNVVKIIKSKVSLVSLTFQSNRPLLIRNLTLSTSERLSQFFQASEWFLANQDEHGGWPIPVKRKFGSDFYPTLEPGWYSAMAQGHALSLLSRAYSLTQDPRYASACRRGVESIFDNNGRERGVRAIFMDKYPWYEEYPTSPSTFVLNGFMYALLGLWDVQELGIPGGADEKARELYNEGMGSLKKLLPLFDTGSGTLYDLRHFTVPGISPNLARLDYHVTHINQLLTFASFEKDPIFSSTAERWIGYTQGERAPHN